MYTLLVNLNLFLYENLGFCFNLKVKELKEDQITKLLKRIESSNLTITRYLKKLKQLVTKKLVTIKSYRVLRQINGFPVKGQLTHSNGKTDKRNKR